MIDRACVGKAYAPFVVSLAEDWLTEWYGLFSRASGIAAPPQGLPVNWPAVLTLHGTACLLHVWEDLGVDPLEVRLVGEEWRHSGAPAIGEEIQGRLRIREIGEHVEFETGIEEQVDFVVEFHDRKGLKLAVYTCSYRIPRMRPS
jgi:hypothetical protein